MEEFQADKVFFRNFLSICYCKSDYKWSDMRNVSIYSILQYILQYGSAVLQFIAMRFLPYCFTPRCNVNAIVPMFLLSPYCILIGSGPHKVFFVFVKNSPLSAKTIKISIGP